MPVINGDLTQRVSVDTNGIDWSPSPSGSVWRKRLHLVGPPEAGQVTSVVRYDADSSFPAHDHPDGEEILVLEGVFSDEHGDWPRGTYLLNPEGFRHAPFSRDGCILFVKLRQFPGRSRQHVAIQTETLPWTPGADAGVEVKPLYAQPGFSDSARLERWAPGTARGRIEYPGGAEIYVLAGSFTDETGAYETGTWLRLPAGSAHAPGTRAGCTLYLKLDGLGYLKQGDGARDASQ